MKSPSTEIQAKVQFADSNESELEIIKKYPPEAELGAAACRPPKPVPIEFAENFDDNTGEFSAKKHIPKTRTKNNM